VFEPPYGLVSLVHLAPSLAEDMAAGVIEGVVLEDRRSPFSKEDTPWPISTSALTES
jgi:hypothetical protein